MSIYAFTGAIGSGKSFYQLRFALEMCEQKNKQLVTNFPLDRINLRKYASIRKLNWITELLDYGGITEVHAPKSLDTLMLPNAVVCIDEAGVLLNSRSWKDTPKDFLADLCQSRKKATDLIYTAQFSEQVDSQMRMLTQYYIHADGLTYYDKITKLPHLYYKRYYYFDAGKHRKWLAKNCGHLKTRLAFTYQYHGGFLTPSDKLLFDCFDSKTVFGKGSASFTKYESLEYSKLCDRPIAKQILHQTFDNRQFLLQFSDHSFSNFIF